MKILFVHDYGVLAGGAERVTVELRDGMRTRGHDARLFASTARAFPLPNQADYTCFGTNGWPRRLLQVANPSAVRNLRRVLTEFQPDVVHVRMFLTQLSPGILPLLARIPTLLHVGNHQTICPINTRILPDESVCTFRAGVVCYQQRCVSALGLARTVVQLRSWRRRRGVFRLIVANSQALARTLRENDVPVTTVIPNGTRVVPRRPPLEDPPLVAYAGRLMPLKGVDVLLHAMAVVARRIPAARLLVVGEGSDRSRLESIIAALSLREHVIMCGHLAPPQLGERLATAWVQAVPSRYLEPFANVIAEAMMRGTALVATATGGSPELVREGRTGYLVTSGDAEQLADRLIGVLGDRALAERLGSAGRVAALADLTVDRMLDRFEEAYAQMLG
ncbi:MAG: glycosyltransferase family 4 protein [Gemmatimonadota bacterium]|nr:glycosyltransferase family 4 protein [Gemmatimonadota bacterium]